MDWTNETVLKFLELYQMHPCIWDPKNTSHKNKIRLNDAWIDIKSNLGKECTVKELKKKKESLMSAYRGYRTKIKKSEKSGAGASDIYQPTWFAYSFMDSFLGTIYKCTQSFDTEDDQNQQIVADSNSSQHDTGDINTVGETDDLNQEQDSSHGRLQHSSTNQGPSNAQKTSTASKRKQYNPPELQETKKQMDQAFNILKTVSQQRVNEEEDECYIFGKLIAKKMRKLSEDRRDLMMVNINELFYNECHRPMSSSMMSTPSPSSRIEQYYSTQVTSPTQLSTANNVTIYDGPPMSSSMMSTPSPSSQIEQEDIPQVVMPPPVAVSYIDTNLYSTQVTSPTQLSTANNVTIYDGPASEMNNFLIFKKN